MFARPAAQETAPATVTADIERANPGGRFIIYLIKASYVQYKPTAGVTVSNIRRHSWAGIQFLTDKIVDFFSTFFQLSHEQGKNYYKSSILIIHYPTVFYRHNSIIITTHI